jgi:hypothetical protein
LLRQHHPAAIATQPAHSPRNQLLVRHRIRFACGRLSSKVTGEFLCAGHVLPARAARSRFTLRYSGNLVTLIH